MTPKISVIIPVYNTEKYLHRCIDSVLAQTYKDFELLLIDDGSKDSSGIICDEYAAKDARVRVFHKENGGVSSARNVGLDHAQGEWITFVDSDDEVKPNWLDLFCMQISYGVELVSQGLIFNNSRSSKLIGEIKVRGFTYIGDIYKSIDFLYRESLVGYLVIKAFKRAIIEKNNIRFNVAYNYHEDEEFFLRYCIYINKVSSISDSGYIYYLPSWSKYKIRNRYQLFRDKWLSIKEIYSKSECMQSYQVVNSYLNDYAYNFMVELSHCNDYRTCLSLVREFRRNAGKNLHSVGLSFITRLAIEIDKTAYFSTLVAGIHAKLKF